MTTINFTTLPSSSAPTFQRNGVTITTNSGNNLVINADSDLLGLGVNDSTIDSGESIFVSFNQGAASGISFILDSATTTDGDDQFAEAELEAFDVNGKSLGAIPFGVAASNIVIANISAAFDGQLISRFRLTQIESARIGSLSFTPVPVLVATADAITTSEDDPVSFNVRRNDTFLLNGSPTISVNTNGLKGNLTNNGNGRFTYDPGNAFQSLTAGQTATTSFKYTLKAGKRSSTATVTLTITGLDDAPVTRPDSATVSNGQAVTIAVLDNDADPENHSLTIDSFTKPANGSVTQNPDGTLTYTASPNSTGPDSFTYIAKDNNNNKSKPTTVTIQPLEPMKPADADALTGAEVDYPGLSSPSDDLLTGGQESAATSSPATSSPAAGLSAEAQATPALLEPTQLLTPYSGHYNEPRSPLGVSTSDLAPISPVSNSSSSALVTVSGTMGAN